MKTMRVASFFLLCAVCLTLMACNTTKGFGKDIEGAGEGIKNSADRNGAD